MLINLSVRSENIIGAIIIEVHVEEMSENGPGGTSQLYSAQAG